MKESTHAIGVHVGRAAGQPVMTRAQSARYEFVASLRMHNGMVVMPAVKAGYREREAAFQSSTGRMPATPEEAGALLEGDPAYQFNRFLFQQVQRLTWDAVAELEPLVKDEIAGNRTVTAGAGGSLRLQDGFVAPKYYEAAEYHLQPGSYHGSELLHIMARYAGPGIFIPGNVKSIPQHLAPALPALAPRRILDVGCGSGRSTICWADVYPEAELFGIDVAPNLLQDAHAAAERRGVAVHYSQQDAQETDFPDGYFDLVVLYTLQHEVPPAPMARVFRELARITAPGGRIINADIAPLRHMPPLQRHLREWEVEHFGEPYVRMAGGLDVPALLVESGLEAIQEHAPDHFPDGLDFPWLTWGDKPAS